MQDGEISSIEFPKVLQEVEIYRKLKADIRNQDKTKERQITKEQHEELLEQERKESKEDFLQKNLRYFRYPGCKCHLKHEAPPYSI